MTRKLKESALLLYTLLCLMWGGAFVLIHLGLKCLNPVELSALRLGTGAIVLSPIILFQFNKVAAKDWAWLAFSGFLGSLLPSFFYATAQQYVSSSMAGVLSSFTPFFTIVLATVIFKDQISRKQVLGISLGFFAGLVLLFFQNGLDFNTSWQGVLVLVATLCYAINLNILKFKLKHIPPLVIASGTLVVPGVLSWAYLGTSNHFLNVVQDSTCATAIWSIIILGCTATAIAIVLFNYLLKISTPAFASSITYVIPVISMLLGAFLLQEEIGMIQLLATGVILYSVSLTKN